MVRYMGRRSNTAWVRTMQVRTMQVLTIQVHQVRLLQSLHR